MAKRKNQDGAPSAKKKIQREDGAVDEPQASTSTQDPYPSGSHQNELPNPLDQTQPIELQIGDVMYVLEDYAEVEEVFEEPLTDDPSPPPPTPAKTDTPSRRAANWLPDEKSNLFLAANSRKHILRGAFQGPGGGNELKRRTWREVAEYVSRVSKTERTAEECKKKASTFASDAKAKFNRLKIAMSKTGGGQLDEDQLLTQDEEMALDYVGEEAVIGVPGVEGVPLRRQAPRKEMKHPWDPKRSSRPVYSEVTVGRKSSKETLQQKRQEEDLLKRQAVNESCGSSKGKGKGKGKSSKPQTEDSKGDKENKGQNDNIHASKGKGKGAGKDNGKDKGY